jgi:hypothetical protein
MITINYLSHDRKDSHKYWEITSHFLNKIKPENKEKVKINILATKVNDWSYYLKGFDFEIYQFPDVSLNYMQKISVALSSTNKYSVKLDEDCFISNHIWDYIIENINVLDDEDNFILTPMLSNGIPHTDRFVESFVEDPQVKQKIYNCYLQQGMPNGLWGVDYSPLNLYTTNADKWNSEEFFKGVENLNTYLKGIHPIRICADAQILLNDYILQNFDKIKSKHNYSIKKFTEPYYTTSTFVIKTEDWKRLLDIGAYDSFDEIQLNLYRRKYNKNFLYIENGFGIHTIYNTVYGNKNIWNIGMEDGYTYEANFVNTINQKLGL